MWIAIALFVILLFTGLVRGEFEWWVVLGFLVVGTGAVVALFVFELPLIWTAAIFAVLDIVLVFWIFKGDVRIS